MPRPFARSVVGVFVTALAFYLPGIGAQEIWSKDEARTALIVREMITNAQWSLPRVPGASYGRKPPLYHWLAALVASPTLDGARLRLPAAVAGAGTVALIYLFGAQLATVRVGLLAACILVSSPSFFEWARIGRMETLLVFCMTLSLWGLGRWLAFGGLRNGMIFGVGIGLGVLTKGPAGLLPLAVAGPALVACRPRPGRVRDLVPGLVIALGLPLAWLAFAFLTAPDFADYADTLVPMIAGELGRSSTSAASLAEGLAVSMFPWTLLLPGTALMLVRAWPGTSPLLIVSLGWLAVVLVVFVVFIAPRAVYFLPAYPALALLMAWGWETAAGRARRWLTVPLAVGGAATIAAIIATTMRSVVVRFHNDPLALPSSIALSAGAVLLVTGVAAWRLERSHRSTVALAVLAPGVLVTLLLFDVGVRTPFYNQLYPIRSTAKHFEDRIRPGVEVGYTEANRVTALAVHLARPLRQLSPAAIQGHPPVPAPSYIILPDVEFAAARSGWSLERVDEVVLHRVRYVLASVGAGAAAPR